MTKLPTWEWSWQYDGRHPWSDIVMWCREHHRENLDEGWFTVQSETIYFYDERTYLLFLLRWS